MSAQSPAEILVNKRRNVLPNIQTIATSKVSHSDFQKGVSSQWNNRGGFQFNPSEAKLSTLPKAGSKVLSALEDLSNQMIKQVHECLKVWICSRFALDRDGFPLYVELAFDDQRGHDPKKLAKRFFENCGAPDKVMLELVGLISKRPLQPIYIPADFAHPRGWFFKQLITRPEHRKALGIALLGHRNPILCRHCCQSYFTNTSWNKEHILYPFSNCVSIRGFMGGKCANCVWHQKPCEWEFMTGYQPKSAIEGPLDWPLLGKDTPANAPPEAGIDQLNPESCPRISCVYPSLIGSADQDNQLLQEMRKTALEERADPTGFWDSMKWD
ncbi:hypothetical protein BHE90_016116 [Fusarium euwallaceae]|uniref:Uncharacterized protein n=1 Tax=Fusarium euwallaceae TaxID=1147111 RepID=A0A430L1D9_9HYPO|nr:hypothetical protein BHE90_016116 [Fusarium euwallaceae]